MSLSSTHPPTPLQPSENGDADLDNDENLFIESDTEVPLEDKVDDDNRTSVNDLTDVCNYGGRLL
jgi:hypothetical protein